ncbi:glutamate receptor 2.8-like [Elaeis guineensis]|uniref:glutamate receptor 2.8-like n=1 Tax=Elaeis guineensis var. tenera TaxID=51953 RepID=UPI00057AF053
MEKPTNFILCVCLCFFLASAENSSTKATNAFHVGVVLDLGTSVGKTGRTSISMAIEDFYAKHSNGTTRLVVHTLDSDNDAVQAASAALDLLKNREVQIIIGPQKSSQAAFVSDLGNKSQVPIVTFSATSPSLSSTRTPYLVRTTVNDSCQVNSIASIIKAYGWREVVPIYEDTDYGRGIIPYLIDALQGIDIRIPYHSMIPLSATNDEIMEELYKLKTMQTRVFIVHMTSPMGSRLFPKAKVAGMMSEGYVWIMTDGLANVMDSLDPSVIDSMQGALGVKPYVPKSRELRDFTMRWKRRFQKDNPSDQLTEPSTFGLWAYDTVWAMAMAAEKVGVGNASFEKPQNATDLTDLDTVGISMNGPKLLKAILESRFRGISGDFHLVDGQLQSSTFQIINVVGRGGRGVGFWTPQYGLSKELNQSMTKAYSTLMTDLYHAIWPGESTAVPKGWEMPVSGKKLRIGVPVRDEIREFINVERDPITNITTVSGYCIDVFEGAIQRLPYAIPHEYVPLNVQGQGSRTYTDLVYQIYLQEYDALVGDVTIRFDRSLYVDFTLPYTESGVSMIVPVKDNTNKNAWIFLRPLSMELWLGSFAFFVFTGFVIWVMEHRINKEFRGPFLHQLGTIFYFSFSTLVYAHREKVQNILSKFVVIIWLFVVLVLTSSYTASLASMLTVQQLQPTITDVQDLLKNGDYVGFNRNSFVKDLLMQLHFDESKIRAYDTPEEYVEALSKGSKNGGVAAIVHEVPYIKQFLAQHCTGYTMIGPIYKTAGFGFVFPKGSPLVPDISRGILNVTDGDDILEIEKKWFGDQNACLNQGSTISSNSLTFHSFWGLFLITGVASTCALTIFLAMFFNKNWHEMRNIDHDKSISRRLISCLKYYDKKDENSYTFRREKTNDTNSDANVNCQGITDIEASLNGDDSQNQLSISNYSDGNSSQQEEKSSSPELAGPSGEA